MSNHTQFPRSKYDLNPYRQRSPRAAAPFNFTPGNCIRRRPRIVSEEVPEEPNELADEYYRFYRPANTAERDMVDSMVENEWTLRSVGLDAKEADGFDIYNQ
jgi:hypothetical protein